MARKNVTNIRPTELPNVDDAQIHLDDEQEVRYWSKTLNVHPAELRIAVQTVGPMVKNVRRHLKK